MVVKDNPKRTRRCCSCLLCVLGTLIVLVVVIVILAFTVFKVRDPIMTLNAIHLGSGSAGGVLIVPGSNITMVVDASVKNPNPGAFKFSSSTSTIFYEDIMVGQAFGPPGKAPARRSLRMNITVALITTRLLKAPNVTRDLGLGLFTMDSFTRAPGKVKLLVVKKNVVVDMNCTVTFNITSQEIQEQRCKSHVKF